MLKNLEAGGGSKKNASTVAGIMAKEREKVYQVTGAGLNTASWLCKPH